MRKSLTAHHIINITKIGVKGHPFQVKPRLFAPREEWREFASRGEVLNWLEKTKVEGLYIYHPGWLVLDWDGGDSDQPLVLSAARAVLAKAGFREGEDYMVVASGGKGWRVVWRYLMASEERNLLAARISRVAKET